MDEYIKREALIQRIRTMPIPKKAGNGNTWLDNCGIGVNAAIREVASFPAADVAPVRSELRKAVGLLNVNYEKALGNPVVRDPVAWALFQTWKVMNRRTGE